MREHLHILLAEDSDDDAELIERALRLVNPKTKLQRVHDGADAIKYLERQGPYSDRTRFPFPDVLLTDLKMPNVSGLELLEWLQKHAECSVIPTILLSGSDIHSDVQSAYKLGANTYFHKPTEYKGLLSLLHILHNYWAQSEFPPPRERC